MSENSTLTLMVVHAHPDDEVITTGGTFLRYAEEGLNTVLVCATRGEEGEIHDPDLDPVEAKPRLGEIRTRELTCAAEKLKIGSLEFLDYRDSGMVGTPENADPRCFHQADLDEATARLVRLVRRYRPQVLVSYNDFGGYGHPDHIKSYQVTQAAFDRAGDPSFAPEPGVAPWQPTKLYEIAMAREMVERWRTMNDEERRERAAEESAKATEPEPEKPPTDDAERSRQKYFFELMLAHSTPLADIQTTIDVARYRDICLDALRCHRTQIPADSQFFKRRLDELADIVNFEHFNRVRSLGPAPEREDDLFAGLR